MVNSTTAIALTTQKGNLLIQGLCHYPEGDFMRYGYFSANLHLLRQVDEAEWVWANETWNTLSKTIEIPKSLFEDLLLEKEIMAEDEEDELYTEGEIIMEDSETHRFVGNYDIYNGIVYAKFYGEIWHGYPGCAGYQQLVQEFTEHWNVEELPGSVRLEPFGVLLNS